MMLILSSCTNNLTQIERFVSDLVVRFHLNEDQHGNILISLTEAVTNAMIHGNKEDVKKSVCIRSESHSEWLKITVSDQGDGFNMEDVPNPTSDERLCCLGGRGVFLMQKLCDGLCFKDNGSTVELNFRI
jgi:serine/threonine-protein kinase RsbW